MIASGPGQDVSRETEQASGRVGGGRTPLVADLYDQVVQFTKPPGTQDVPATTRTLTFPNGCNSSPKGEKQHIGNPPPGGAWPSASACNRAYPHISRYREHAHRAPLLPDLLPCLPLQRACSSIAVFTEHAHPLEPTRIMPDRLVLHEACPSLSLRIEHVHRGHSAGSVPMGYFYQSNMHGAFLPGGCMAGH